MVLRSAWPAPWLASLGLALASACAAAGLPDSSACSAGLQPGPAGPLAIATARGTFEVAAAAQPPGTAPGVRLDVRKASVGSDQGAESVLQGTRVPLFSGLVTKGLAPITLSEVRIDGVQLTGILRADQAPALLGLVVTQGVPQGGRTTAAYWLASELSPQAAPAAVAALEHMYAHVLRLPPQDDYAWVQGTARVLPPAARGQQTQGGMLAQIAAWRNCALRSLPLATGGNAPRPWQTVDLRPQPAAAIASADGHLVTVAVDRSAEELHGSSITFTRQPHLVCQVAIGVDGVASCRLADAHFHEHQHDNEGETTTATFSGALRGASVLLPTTTTWRHGPPAFAKPFDPGFTSPQRP